MVFDIDHRFFIVSPISGITARLDSRHTVSSYHGGMPHALADFHPDDGFTGKTLLILQLSDPPQSARSLSP